MGAPAEDGLVAPPRATACRVCGGPRWDRASGALCETHFRETHRAEMRKSRQGGAPSCLPDRQRIDDYRAEAVRQGAAEDESWWIAMAAEARFQREGRSTKWLVAFVAAELEWLRVNTKVLAKLDRERGVA